MIITRYLTSIIVSRSSWCSVDERPMVLASQRKAPFGHWLYRSQICRFALTSISAMSPTADHTPHLVRNVTP